MPAKSAQDRGWYDAAKFGIFVHWGLYSLVAWAETEPTADPRHSNYVEWYRNTILIEDSPAAVRHRRMYGPKWTYESLVPEFQTAADGCDVAAWADLFARAGAKYVVPVTKHHDGFCLWPPDTKHPSKPGWHTNRDVIGDLKEEVERRRMRFGVYYSGGFDWTFPMNRGCELPLTTMAQIPFYVQHDPTYASYVREHYGELIRRFSPSILWNDVGYPHLADCERLVAAFRAQSDGVVNDRFQMIDPVHLVPHDFVTRERVVDDVPHEKWELCRGIGTSFGYNQNENPDDYPSVTELVHQLIDVVSKGGNFLLNVGPDFTGKISLGQASRLEGIGAWLKSNGEAIYGTRPWPARPHERPYESATGDGIRVEYTRTDAALYAIVLGKPAFDASVLIGGLPVSGASKVSLLGSTRPVKHSMSGRDVVLELDVPFANAPAYTFKITPCP